ncbi:MAG TPA: NmrA family NAD(P)-binding protein [Opitutaceae bacterium]|nr:NmrA family NAD(P)-binding protein [Opitutaceae bacterium]
MHKPKILVTAAAGKTGAATVLQLLKKGYRVRAMVHRADARSRDLESVGAEVMVGSLEDITDLRLALGGIQRAYFCSPLIPGTLRRAMLFATAAGESRLEATVVLSQWLADPLHPAVHAREKWLSLEVLRQVPGMGLITINPGFFADNYMVALEPIAHFGIMGMPLGEGLNAPPSNEDIARVVVGSLLNPGPHIGKSYRPTGPRLLSPGEIAAILGRVLGRRVKYRDISINLFLRAARSLGVAPFILEELSWFLQDYQRNSFGIGAPTGAVQEVGGSDPEEFELIVRRYVTASRLNQRTFGTRARAALNLMKTLFLAAPDIEKIRCQLALPEVKHAVLAADSDLWLDRHGAGQTAANRARSDVIARSAPS